MEKSNNNICLNCSQRTKENYCSNCGQKTNVERYSIKYILSHDILHGIFHIDRGFPYTLKELFTRPGHSIREYIDGKRIRHFHFFTFIIIALLFNKLFSTLVPFDFSDIDPVFDNKFFQAFNIFLKENIKSITLSIIPLQALISFTFFRKSKLNYSEHIVIASYISGASLFIDVLFPFVVMLFTNSLILSPFSFGIDIIKIIYSTCFFYQYFSFNGLYTKASNIIRSLLSSLIVLVITYLIISLLFLIS
jgi:hypothetical protein